VKRKRPELVERRRPLVEINLAADTKSRPAMMARRGCALFGSVVALLAASAAAWLGLH
jgi:hypothetical protein